MPRWLKPDGCVFCHAKDLGTARGAWRREYDRRGFCCSAPFCPIGLSYSAFQGRTGYEFHIKPLVDRRRGTFHGPPFGVLVAGEPLDQLRDPLLLLLDDGLEAL